MAVLEQELKYFAENRAKLAENHLNKFALVKGEKLIGVYDNDEAAIAEGAKRFASESFLVRQIKLKDEEVYIPVLALGLLHATTA